MNQKTFLIGIDGASWNYINPLLKKSKLPSLNHLMKQGVSGILKSTIPPFSPVAWSSFITGTLPQKHGIYDWCRINIKNAKIKIRNVSAFDRAKISFWKYLNEAGYKVGVYNIPLTFPAEKVKGFFISGFDSPDFSKYKYYPTSILNEILNKYDTTSLKLPDFNKLNTIEEREEFANKYKKYCQIQTEIFIEYVKKYDIDIGIINYMINDHFNHRLKEHHLFLKGLEICDINIGKIIEEFPNANYFILSDHGSLRTENALLIYKWLNKNQLTIFNEKKLKTNKINTVLSHMLKKNLPRDRKLLEKLLRKSLMSLMEISPEMLLNFVTFKLAKANPDLEFWPHNSIDIRKSKIIFSSAGSNGFYINPIIKSDKKAYQKTIDTILTYMDDLRDPTGNKIFRDIHINLYNNGRPLDLKSPDLIAELEAPCNIWIKEYIDSTSMDIFVSNYKIKYYGRHIPDGIYIFSGSFVDKYSKIIKKEMSITDLPSLVLSLYKIPIPDDFDTTINLSNLINKKKYNMVQNNNKSNPESSEEIKRKLSELGYM